MALLLIALRVTARLPTLVGLDPPPGSICCRYPTQRRTSIKPTNVRIRAKRLHQELFPTLIWINDGGNGNVYLCTRAVMDRSNIRINSRIRWSILRSAHSAVHRDPLPPFCLLGGGVGDSLWYWRSVLVTPHALVFFNWTAQSVFYFIGLHDLNHQASLQGDR